MTESPDHPAIKVEADRIVLRGDWVSEIVAGVTWSETENIAEFNELFELDGHDYMAAEGYYQGVDFMRVIRRNSDGRLFGYPYWESPGNDGLDGQYVSNGEDHGFAYEWDEKSDEPVGGEVWVWLPVEPFAIAGYRIALLAPADRSSTEADGALRMALAAALWNLKEGYSIEDVRRVGHDPATVDWSDRNEDDVTEKALYLGHAETVLTYLTAGGWTPPPAPAAGTAPAAALDLRAYEMAILEYAMANPVTRDDLTAAEAVPDWLGVIASALLAARSPNTNADRDLGPAPVVADDAVEPDAGLVETVLATLDDHPDCQFKIAGGAHFECGIEVLTGPVRSARRRHLEIALSRALANLASPEQVRTAQAEALPVHAHKGPHDTDASLFEQMATNLDNGHDVGGSNSRRALAMLIRREVARAARTEAGR